MQHKLVLIILILSNILNLFTERYGIEGNRQIIYMTNALAFVITFIFVLPKITDMPKYYHPMIIFALIFIGYLYWQFISPNSFFVLNEYVRWAMCILFLFFFYYFEEDKISTLLMRIYIVTFILDCSLKIYNGSPFAAIEDINKRVGGDMASIGLALVIPLALTYFKNKASLVIYTICLMVSMLSLRRTSLLAIIIAFPFIWPVVKKHIKRKYLLLGVTFSVYLIYKTWNYVGAKLIVRFGEEYNESSDISSYGSDVSSYGSGRTEFWDFLLTRFFELEHWFLGNGMGSVYETYSNGWRIALSHAHNDFLEILFTFGFVGLLLWLLFFFESSRYVAKSPSYANKRLFFCSILIYMVVALTSGCILRAEMFPMAIAIPVLLPKATLMRRKS